ncbi:MULTISPECIES: NAD(P)-dependent oxidoreductase [unclassified Mesorhizobium]|uniref:NAD-dependent epimerase/dehydratase family protein n=1 Tax=unclassified Mesorhizobium TaxID=325217 RepID=UPI00241579A5|nr:MULTISPECIES: NAD(P)-dependent oxidoreductase [unclassified Mesorhizobium]MDG4889950.1 NAD(P)-dependent oxidoreductase [Mesorhizobium sp. WSM4887]MDG4904093.1 NAD(P)-dependent oxidoreductase [Mesorhizobium sp. WSM4962]MDG4909120.1 NAD(P)-dependent oxidoreductase [Mesorhizobium sp. WSM4898]MDG4921744.1 NAD(P)-dependent oxidoreductase [Mesorhizobium sp. WSM4989]
MNYDRILLTGAAGLLGSVLRKRLAPQVKLLRSTDIVDLAHAAPNEELVKADLGDSSAAADLVRDIDAIVHFGGLSKDADFASICRVNIVGFQSLYEAARLAGVKRVVFASSVHAIGFYDQNDVIGTTVPQRPDSNYGLAKAFGENLAQLYWDKYGLETVSIRIGSCEPKPSTRRHLLTWLSFDDMCQLVERSLSAPRVRHTVIYGASNNAASFWDNSLARHIGYRPKDTADDFREEILASDPRPDRDDVVNRLQGGVFAL